MRKIVYLLLGALFLFSCKDDDEALLKPENIQGGGNGTQGDIIRISSSKNVVQGDSSFVLTVTLPEGKVEEYPLTLSLRVKRNFNGEDVDQNALFEDFPTQLTIPAGQSSVSDTIKLKQNEEKTQEFEVKITTSVIEGYTVQPSPLVILLQYKKKENGGTEDPGALTDEVKVYDDPSKPIYEYPGFGVGSAHPSAAFASDWVFYTAHEFLVADQNQWGPMGMWAHATAGVEGDFLQIATDACADVIAKEDYPNDAYLKMFSLYSQDPVKNGQNKMVNWRTSAFYAPRPGQGPHWCNFQEGMRIEVRLRRTEHGNCNYAVWFMGGSNTSGNVSWPACGEIDLLESPHYGEAHFTLHSENHASTTGNSITASTAVTEQSKWNIYWMEWTTTEIKAGVNDRTYFTQALTAEAYQDWKTFLVNSGDGVNAGKGFNLILTTGLGAAWAGGMPDPNDIDPTNPPAMEIDWIRVWQKKGTALKPVKAPTNPGPKGAAYWKPKN